MLVANLATAVDGTRFIKLADLRALDARFEPKHNVLVDPFKVHAASDPRLK